MNLNSLSAKASASIPFAATHPMFAYDVGPISQNIADKFRAFENFVVVGMGGSSLPLQVLSDALPQLKNHIHFLDSVDPLAFKRAADLPKALYCVVSKSGETYEVWTLFNELRKKFDNEHFLIVTDPARGKLRETAEKEKILSLPIPPSIGGRFTHFTPFHRALFERFGLPFADWMKIARTEIEKLKSNAVVLEMLFAEIFAIEPRRSNIVLWAYGEKLLGLALWAQQALGESLGKKDAQGNRKGVFPIVLRGPQDQHSVLQCLIDGPQDKTFWFFVEAALKNPAPLEKAVGILSESTMRTFEERLQDEDSYQPLVRWTFDLTKGIEDIVRAIVGIQAFVEYAGVKLGINAFDQPGVERGKQIARELMSRSS